MNEREYFQQFTGASYTYAHDDSYAVIQQWNELTSDEQTCVYGLALGYFGTLNPSALLALKTKGLVEAEGVDYVLTLSGHKMFDEIYKAWMSSISNSIVSRSEAW